MVETDKSNDELRNEDFKLESEKQTRERDADHLGGCIATFLWIASPLFFLLLSEALVTAFFQGADSGTRTTIYLILVFSAFTIYFVFRKYRTRKVYKVIVELPAPKKGSLNNLKVSMPVPAKSLNMDDPIAYRFPFTVRVIGVMGVLFFGALAVSVLFDTDFYGRGDIVQDIIALLEHSILIAGTVGMYIMIAYKAEWTFNQSNGCITFRRGVWPLPRLTTVISKEDVARAYSFQSMGNAGMGTWGVMIKAGEKKLKITVRDENTAHLLREKIRDFTQTT